MHTRCTHALDGALDTHRLAVWHRWYFPHCFPFEIWVGGSTSGCVYLLPHAGPGLLCLLNCVRLGRALLGKAILNRNEPFKPEPILRSLRSLSDLPVTYSEVVATN